MEAMRRSRSSSAMSKQDGVEILEISGSARSSTNALESPANEIVTEPSEEHVNIPKRMFLSPDDTIQIEECQITEQEPEVESHSSSDNISQYLDKEEPLPQKNDTALNGDTDKSDVVTKEQLKRAKSEEAQPRKRKLSAESSYSRISLSKLGMLKKLRDVKSKIKPSKLTFSASKFKIPIPQKTSKTSSEVPGAKELKKTTTVSVKQPEQPVYIHIPLKPPEGETEDLEKTEVPSTTAEEKTETTPRGFAKVPELRTSRKALLKINPAFKQLLKDVNKLGESEKKDVDNPKELPVTSMDVAEPEKKTSFLEAMEVEGNEDTSMETENKDNEEMVIDTDEAQDISELKFQKPLIIKQKYTAELPKDDESKDTAEPKIEEDVFDNLFKASTRKTQRLEVSESESEQRKVRSKSAEPERKRKVSIDSSYSRKSTSKVGIMKKLKEASDTIKSAFSLSSLKKEKQLVTKTEEKPERKKSKTVNITKPIPKVDPSKLKPVYIHIPLKPPPGQTDEFSYLEFEEKREEPTTVPSDATKESPTPQSSPGSPARGASGVQFIFLTPPSDDETLNEKTPDIPETPSTESTVFFNNKIDELKQLAQSAVDKVSPESSQKKLLEPVSEESSSEKSLGLEDGNDKNAEEDDKKNDTAVKEVIPEIGTQKVEPQVVEVQERIRATPKEEGKMLIDVEDGLSEAPTKPEEQKPSLKTETSPVMKKKVSFKRRSKTPKDSEKESDYEEVSPPSDTTLRIKGEKENDAVVTKKEEDSKDKDISLLQASQSVSLSADEEKMYLDQKIGKDTSLEEDYTKWSKESDHDHEYEPINPPDEETFIESPQATPSAQLTISDEKTSSRIPPLKTETVIIQTKPKEVVKPKESLRTRIFHFHHSDNEEDEPESATPTASNESKKPSSDGPNKLQLALKQKTEQIKNKFHNMKKPSITLPQRPKFNKPDFKKIKIDKSKFKFPKMSDSAKITFTMPKRSNTSVTSKRSLKKRNLSTESNDGDSKKSSIFDFSTYPKPFKKKPKQPLSSESQIPNYATNPRQKNATEISEASSIRIPLHSEKSTDIDYNDDNNQNIEEFEREEFGSEDSVERRILESSPIRYKDIDIDDDYARENQEINKAERWQHGNFNPHQDAFEERFRQQQEDFDEHFRNSQYKVTDLDSPEDENRNFTNVPPMNKSAYSSEGSVGGPSPRPGVLEEIDSDQFIVREKGLSQDNIEIGQWISSEIREAFKTPTNALNEIRNSNQSLPLEGANKRKPVRKPKRKKTPHVSQEKLAYYDDDESMEDLPADEVPPPARPKRRSKRTRKPKGELPVVAPYQETIPIDKDSTNMDSDRLQYQRESLAGILGDDEREDIECQMYENQKMKGKEQPEIKVTDPYRNFEFVEAERRHGRPTAPPRRHRSLRSLTLSENDSTTGFNMRYDQEEENNEINRATEEELRKYIMPSTTTEDPPRRPARSRSHASSLSRGTSLKESESLLGTESYTSESQEKQIPCVEEPCMQDIRDYMGYAIVDKHKLREPPLPPPRTPERRNKRSVIEPDMKFSTVPRVASAVAKDEPPPVRPLRNYSTLQQVKQKPSVMDPSVVYQNKENIDIIQYIELDDDLNRNLQRGEVVEKMKIRPLPAPPRPPRKTKLTRRSLQDITAQSNIILSDQHKNQTMNKNVTDIQEETVSTQTEPLPEGFVCEELVQEPSDTLIEPSTRQRTKTEDTATVERRLITPTHYMYEETVTHGALVVEPLNGNKILPDSEISSRERTVAISREESDEETSRIPEDFAKMKDPATTANNEIPILLQELIKTQKLQISDLDVDKLTVNQLLANKIVVSEIESSSVQAGEIKSRSGDIKINELSLPPELVKEIVKSLTQQTQSDETKIEQKKTSTNVQIHRDFLENEEKNTPPTPPPRISSQPPETLDHKSKTSSATIEETHLEPSAEPRERSLTPPTIEYQVSKSHERSVTPSTVLTERETAENDSASTPTEHSESIETPQRPPRRNLQMLEPEVDDEPPPRPPQPEVHDGPPPPRPPEPEEGYFPSQPPASFYALRATQFVENLDREANIPVVPRRKHHKRPLSRSQSTSEESSNAAVVGRTRHFRRYSEPNISELTGRLMRACGDSVNASLKRLIFHVSNNVLGNADGKQDAHVMIIILLALIAGLILLGYGDEKTVVHLHHWEYFNPPKDT